MKHYSFFKKLIYWNFYLALVLAVSLGSPLICKAELGIGAETKPMITLEQKLNTSISLDLRDMNVVDVYKFLAMKGDFNLSVSNNIKGRTTLYLNKVTIKDTLDIITISNNLGYNFIGDNIIHVMTDQEYTSMYGKKFGDMKDVKIVYLNYAKPAYVLEALKNIKSDIGKIIIDGDTGSLVMIDTKEHLQKMDDAIKALDHPLEMKVFNLNYADAEEVAKRLRKELENKSVGAVDTDIRSNQVIVRAFPDRMKEVELLVKAMDKKTKAVLIEVKILKLILNPQYDMGIDWEAVFKNDKYIHPAGKFAIDNTATNYGQMAIGDINVNDFNVTLRMNKQISETKVLANPSLMVLNNNEARIHIGDKLAYVTTTTIGAGDSQRTNEEIHYIDVGVQFTVTPTINEQGFISMKLSPEISSQSGTLTTPQGAQVPLINSALVESNVIVEDGQTIIIGGLRQDELVTARNGVPYFMDVPVLGNMFSKKSLSDTKTEIAILLTPHIIGNERENYADRMLSRERKIMPDKKY
ncbi:MAG: hypothetical protein HQL30_04195 [Candidatus Omnitrophica bacterium]|nr:hypothetical protein [Candidatus Omnitrophota bacterium]